MGKYFEKVSWRHPCLGKDVLTLQRGWEWLSPTDLHERELISRSAPESELLVRFTPRGSDLSPPQHRTVFAQVV